jgi:hypothetical protein
VSRYKSDDVELLLPAFRVVAKMLLQRMTAWGFKPTPFDTVRTAAEAAKNAAKGTGSANSMHRWGCAMDVICDDHGWSCAVTKCEFYTFLGREAKDLKLVWGGDWARRDYPHVQAIPVAWQPQMRAIAISPETVARRNQVCVNWLLRPIAKATP